MHDRDDVVFMIHIISIINISIINIAISMITMVHCIQAAIKVRIRYIVEADFLLFQLLLTYILLDRFYIMVILSIQLHTDTFI